MEAETGWSCCFETCPFYFIKKIHSFIWCVFMYVCPHVPMWRSEDIHQAVPEIRLSLLGLAASRLTH